MLKLPSIMKFFLNNKEKVEITMEVEKFLFKLIIIFLQKF